MMPPTILLIEDAPADVLLTRRALRKSHIQADLVVVGDGLDAVNRLFPPEGSAAPGEPPVLILLDLHLPRVSGLHLLERIRQEVRTRMLPVAVLSSSELVTDRQRSTELGADLYVPKPIDAGKLRNLVQQLGLSTLLFGGSEQANG